jgi:hypothetical protein
MAVFWDVAGCSLLEVYRRFRGVSCLHLQGDDGGRYHIWNVGLLLSNYTKQDP